MSPAAVRVRELDGLRGIAAVIVVAFHYLALLHPAATAPFGDPPWSVTDTPLGIFWNGPFAVSVFFALSGYVIAAAADRRRKQIVANLLTRYLRLAVPVLASVMLAWALLRAYPTAASEFRDSLAEPSGWFDYTYQDAIPGAAHAVGHAVAGTFLSGGSLFNNVLWTMKIELYGSCFIFVLYWLSAGRLRIVLLALAAFAIFAFASKVYLGFVLGALLYEAHVRDLIRRLPAAVPALALPAGILIGAPGEGSWERWGMPSLPRDWTPGYVHGIWPVIGSALIVLAALSLHPFNRVLASPLAQYLGRISFGLYLVHVPPLYTLVASSYSDGASELVLLPLYLLLTWSLAHLFTLTVDEPVLQVLRKGRNIRIRRRAAVVS